MPAGMARLILEGNANNPNIDMTFTYEIMAVNETAFSFAIPFESYALGVSLKSLQGLLYMGVDPDSSKADFITTPLAVHGSGRYYIRSGVGGKGWGAGSWTCYQRDEWYALWSIPNKCLRCNKMERTVFS